MSHGYDSATVPDRLSREYLNAVIESFKTGDLTPRVRFLLSRHDGR